MSDEAFAEITVIFISKLTLWAVPLFLAVFSFAFEILYHMKIPKPFTFHLKRFVGRMILSVMGASLLSATTIVLNMILSSSISIETSPGSSPFSTQKELFDIYHSSNLVLPLLLLHFWQEGKRLFLLLEPDLKRGIM